MILRQRCLTCLHVFLHAVGVGDVEGVSFQALKQAGESGVWVSDIFEKTFSTKKSNGLPFV